MTQVSRIGRFILLLWSMHGVLSYLFAHTQGLAYPDINSVSGISYVNELQSSGGNDNICIEVGVVLAAIAVVWGGGALRCSLVQPTLSLI